MPRTRSYLSSLEIGEVSADFLRNAAEDFLPRAMKTALNIVLKASGGYTRRPGSQQLAQLIGESVRFRYRGRGVTEELVFSNARVDVYATDGTLNQTITASVPWVTADLDNLAFDSDSNRVFVASQTFMTRELTRADDGTWSLSTFTFAGTVNGKVGQPFYDKFNPIDVTMSIAAYTGNGIAISFSGDVLVSDHVGTRFRYLTACEVEIASVTNATTGTVNIIDALYPTLSVAVADSSDYKPGQVVQGTVSDVIGLVSSVPSGTTLQIVLLEGYTEFAYDASSDDATDTLVGPEGSQKLTASPTTVSTPAASSIWDEQLISDVRGFPGTVVVHKNRLMFSRFGEATDVLCGSSLGNFYDFEVGVEDTSAFNEELGADPNSQIRYLVSTEQLLVITDRGIYFVPESPENPLTPSSLEFSLIGPDGAALVPPVIATEGVLFIDADAGRLMLVAMTGNVRRPWQVAELSEAAYHLLTGPKRMVVANGLDGRNERYALIMNEDGSFACMMYRRGAETVGFSKWTHGNGTFVDVTATEDDVVVTSKVGATYTMSQLGFAYTVDDTQDYASALSGLDGQTVEVVKDRAVVATGLVASNAVTDVAAASGLSVGYDFDVEGTPAPPVSTSAGWARQRITRVWVDIRDTGTFFIDDVEFTAFGPFDALDDPGKVRSGHIEAFQLGWDEDATKRVHQKKGKGHRFDVRSITMEVSR